MPDNMTNILSLRSSSHPGQPVSRIIPVLLYWFRQKHRILRKCFPVEPTQHPVCCLLQVVSTLQWVVAEDVRQRPDAWQRISSLVS
jgi:hypothetical protein